MLLHLLQTLVSTKFSISRLMSLNFDKYYIPGTFEGYDDNKCIVHPIVE